MHTRSTRTPSTHSASMHPVSMLTAFTRTAPTGVASAFTLTLLLGIALISGCVPDKSTSALLTTSLVPGNLGDEQRLGWSPKAAAVPLKRTDGGLEGEIHLGSVGSPPFRVRLEKGDGAEYYNLLRIDSDRDGSFDESETLETTPNEVRHKMWSSFKTQLDVTVADSATGMFVTNPYPMSLWFVEDPREAQTDLNLRFTRSGWMQGRIDINGAEAHIRVSESELDGRFTLDDEWTLTLPDSSQNLFSFKHDRPLRRHAWLGEQAYRIVSLSQDGRSVTIEPTDPGVTRAKEAEDDDQMSVDRRAPRSGDAVVFRTNFAAAEAEAKSSGKPLFIDFETVWCGPCKSMEEWVYTADSVVNAASNVISVKVDGDDFPNIVDRFEVTGYPTMLLVAPSGTVTKRLVGYQGVEAITAFLSQS